MKKFLLICLLLAIPLGVAEAKKADRVASVIPVKTIPVPKPILVERDWEGWQTPAKIAQNNDPFKTQPGTTVQVPNPPTGSPVNVNLPASPPNDFLQYLWMLVVTLVGSMLGIPQLKNAFGSSPLHLDPNHPDVKKVIHDAVVQVIQSGVLQGPVQGGLSLIPGVGGILAGLEPTAKAALLRALLADQGQVAVPQPQPQPVPSPGLPQDLLDMIAKLIDAKLKEKQT